MAKNHIELHGKGSGQALLWWLGALLLATFAWATLGFLADSGLDWALALCGLGLLSALQAIAVAQGLGYSRLVHVWRYRSAFLAPFVSYLVYWIFQSLIWVLTGESLRGGPLFLPGLAVVSLAAFAGGLIATSLNEGLWENNSPPPAQIKEQVHQLHLQIAGLPAALPRAKRLFDILLSLLGLFLSLPVWLVSVFLIWFEDPGPVLFVKNSVGLGGLNFHQFKLRTMVSGAEESTGPVLSEHGDQRVLAFGRLLRKTALDELPQLINILLGEMSFVGPRPQRTVLVHGYLQNMPEYAQRHAILPGLAGLAQVAGDYYLTPRQKLRYDRLYIRYAGLGFDIKLIVLAFALAFWFRWQPDWNGRLPRKLIRFGGK